MKRLQSTCAIATLCVVAWTMAAHGALINAVQSPPIFNFNSNGQTTYDAASGKFAIDALTLTVTFEDGNFAFVDDPRPFSIRLQVDASGVPSSNGQVDDLSMQGSIDVDGDGTYDYTGTLLTGTIKSFGFLDSGTVTDSFDFLFTVTGGTMAGFFQGGDIGVVITSENSSFTGSFTTSFKGKAKGSAALVRGPLAMECAESTGQVNVAYESSLQATGGTPPYTYAITAGALPDGLTLNENGTITGTPTAPGTATFTAQVTDASGASAGTVAINCGITVVPAPLTLLCAGDTGQVGTAYTSALVATGGTPPYVFSITEGALPDGLTLYADGTIAGTPTAAGTFTYTAQVVDASGTVDGTAVVNCDITIAPPPLSIACADSDGEVGAAYASAFIAQGGVSPYVFTIIAGNLPDGLTLNDDGTIAGTPTTAGTFALTIQVTDASGGSAAAASTNCGITINTPPLSLACAESTGQVGVEYASAFVPTGGVAPYTFSITSGALPGGLTLNADGSITGTPTAAGDFNFTVQVVDASGTAAGSTSLGCGIKVEPRVNPEPISAVCAGNSGKVGKAYSAAIQVVGGVEPYSFKLISGSLPPGLTLKADGTISGTPTKAGTYAYAIRVTDGTGTSAGATVVDCSITIEPSCLPASIIGTVKCTTNDKAIPGAYVKVYDCRNNAKGCAQTRCDGKYSITNLAPGRYTVKIKVPCGYQACSDATTTVTLDCGETETVDFCVCPPCSPAKIVGTVKCTTNGKTISGAAVKIYDSRNQQKGSATTGCDGKYSIANLPTGTYTVKITPPCKYEACSDTSVTVSLACNETKTVDFCICPPCASAKITGTVKCTTNGKTIANATVTVIGAGNQQKGSAKTSCDGKYSIGNLPAGTYTVKIAAPCGYQACSDSTASVTLSCSQSKTVDFCICPACPAPKVVGTVKCDSTGKGISGVAVKVYDARNQQKGSATTGCDGKYSITNLPTGNYTVKISTPCGYKLCGDSSVAVKLECGDTDTVNFCICPPEPKGGCSGGNSGGCSHGSSGGYWYGNSGGWSSGSYNGGCSWGSGNWSWYQNNYNCR